MGEKMDTADQEPGPPPSEHWSWLMRSEISWLVGIEGDLAGRMFRLRPGRTRIGSAAPADVVIDDRAISRLHCEVCLGKGGQAITDHGSKNGTYVNDRRVKSAPLYDRDV